MKICNFTITKNYKYNKDYNMIYGYDKNDMYPVRNGCWVDAGFARNIGWITWHNASIFFDTRF